MMNDIILVILFNSKNKAWVQDYNILDEHLWAFSDGNTVWQALVEKPFNFCLIEEDQFFEDSNWDRMLKDLVQKSGRRKVYGWVHGSGASKTNKQRIIDSINDIGLAVNLNSFHNTNNYLHIKETIKYYYGIKTNNIQGNLSPLSMLGITTDLHMMRKAILEPLVALELLWVYKDRFDKDIFDKTRDTLKLLIKLNDEGRGYLQGKYGCNHETINVLFNSSLAVDGEINKLNREVAKHFSILFEKANNFLIGACDSNESEDLSIFHSNLENLASKLEYVISRTEG